MMNKSKAIKNSECYYELNMLNLLLKMNLLTEEEYKSILEIVLEESESVLLTVLRMLKTLGVRVYFEEQALDSDKMNAELFVTLPGLAAQQESINISDNMRWSYRKRMESGDFNTTYPAFGYRISNNELIVNEDEAKTVSTIFALYLQVM